MRRGENDLMSYAAARAEATGKTWYVVRRYGMLRAVCNLQADDEVLRTYLA
jgi:hypothetical protein